MSTLQVPLAKHSLLNSFPLTLNLLTTTIVAPPSNASKWQMGFNSAFKGLIRFPIQMTDMEERLTLIQPEKERILIDNIKGFCAKLDYKDFP